MSDIIQLEDKYYILANSPLADTRTLEVKQGETFAVFDRHGDILSLGRGEQGLYHEGTRFLSYLQLELNGQRPLLLSSTVKEDNALIAVNLTNPELILPASSGDGEVLILHGTLHIFRGKLLWQGVYYEHVRVTHFGSDSIDVTLSLRFDADFADIFEVRGVKRRQRGQRLETATAEQSVVLAYRGLDGVRRQVCLDFSPRPQKLHANGVEFGLHLPPRVPVSVYLTAACESGDDYPRRVAYDNALALSGKALKDAHEQDCRIYTSNDLFNHWMNRNLSDLRMMVSDTPHGPYPYAGIPWFSTVFGRDGLITALSMLWMDPGMARGVLSYLAATQAQERSPEQDAEPGKILHEMRKGEMAVLGEIPFGRYYGSVDATPLFVVLVGAHYQRTGDRQFVETLWPHIEAALDWIDHYGDSDGDGFVDYARYSFRGLVQQGWKDSDDSVFHADGALAKAPIALCEVQGYVYKAKLAAAELAAALGDEVRARALGREAQALKGRFEQAFWCEDLCTYALALDGSNRPCRIRTSNAGHCLFTGIVSEERARRTGETLLSHGMFSGWGVRTVASSEARYNPMSYHNGSIWPHDNAVIASGLAQYGLKDMAIRILTGLFDASLFMHLHRLPELFCGFERRPGESPIRYPVACEPQAWAAASSFMLLEACLGLRIDATQSTLKLWRPELPPFLRQVRISNLRVGNAKIDLLMRRRRDNADVSVNVLRREGRLDVVLVR